MVSELEQLDGSRILPKEILVSMIFFPSISPILFRASFFHEFIGRLHSRQPVYPLEKRHLF